MWSNHGWLVTAPHSGTLSHYCHRGLLAAGFHPWPVHPLLSQPEYLGLLHGTHIDGKLVQTFRQHGGIPYTELPASGHPTIRLHRGVITEDANLPVKIV
ncbi:hypothetical protein EVAR_69038_1 [Eumeta japonica]|uniref:Uncharacterized protein n=1 Tax=Eumeta variegata TaxID=151549 RepID=A0A4C1SQT0_EUMVA|nr:hypothetical protein EVAR_69038_1 [Eumeta japonica]